jgi:hypothetical protein
MMWPFAETRRPSRAPGAGLFLATLLAAVAFGCGDQPFHHPTDPPRVSDTWSSQVAAHEWACTGDFLVLRDFVARVEPTLLYLQLWRGHCGPGGELVTSSSTGTLAPSLPSGVYSLRIGNPTEHAVTYTIEVSYLTPSI